MRHQELHCRKSSSIIVGLSPVLAVAALGLLGGVPLHASNITVSFSAGSMFGIAGSSPAFFANIVNNGPIDEYLTSISASVGGFTVDSSPFSSGSLANNVLTVGSQTGPSELFAVNLPDAGSNPYGGYSGIFNLLGGTNFGNTGILASVAFSLQAGQNLPSSAVSLVQADQTGAPGNLLSYSGNVANLGGGTLYLNAAQVNSPFASDTSPFFASPLFLTTGTAALELQLFSVTLPNDGTVGTFAGSVDVFGGVDGGAQDNIGSAQFTSTAASPEPGTIGLLISAAFLLVPWRNALRSRAARF